MKIAVYGNLIYDQILHIAKKLVPGDSHNCGMSYSPGGIANFCRAAESTGNMTIAVSSVGSDDAGTIMLKERFSTAQHLTVKDGKTSRAVVVVDRQGNERTGFVEWGVCRDRTTWEPENADWHHYMYLDRLKINKHDLSRCVGPTSADLVDSRNANSLQDLIENLDYLITSAHPDHDDWPGPWPKKGVIAHRPWGSKFYINSDVSRAAAIAIQPGLNVLGAGDYFAAFCVANLYKNEFPDLVKAHHLTTDFLRRQT